MTPGPGAALCLSSSWPHPSAALAAKRHSSSDLGSPSLFTKAYYPPAIGAQPRPPPPRRTNTQQSPELAEGQRGVHRDPDVTSPKGLGRGTPTPSRPCEGLQPHRGGAQAPPCPDSWARLCRPSRTVAQRGVWGGPARSDTLHCHLDIPTVLDQRLHVPRRAGGARARPPPPRSGPAAVPPAHPARAPGPLAQHPQRPGAAAFRGAPLPVWNSQSDFPMRAASADVCSGVRGAARGFTAQKWGPGVSTEPPSACACVHARRPMCAHVCACVCRSAPAPASPPGLGRAPRHRERSVLLAGQRPCASQVGAVPPGPQNA